MVLIIAGGVFLGLVAFSGFSCLGAGWLAAKAVTPSSGLARKAASNTAAKASAQIHGAAAVLWASEHDDFFPSQEEFPQAVARHVKRTLKLPRFTYTFDRVAAIDITAPANTAIGYAEGEGVRWVAYADGSVRKATDPPLPSDSR
jgi:hypothetical protein